MVGFKVFTKIFKATKIQSNETNINGFQILIGGIPLDCLIWSLIDTYTHSNVVPPIDFCSQMTRNSIESKVNGLDRGKWTDVQNTNDLLYYNYLIYDVMHLST